MILIMLVRLFVSLGIVKFCNLLFNSIFNDFVKVLPDVISDLSDKDIKNEK